MKARKKKKKRKKSITAQRTNPIIPFFLANLLLPEIFNSLNSTAIDPF